ncbi:MAG: hypothetical protein DPW18_10060 [Chloroflexi bacterium]|nr:hypothetical protein [Chloroflexota bacterium]MDL1943322.1 hypothetical protein [Chloroflexi bacterium CFX2]
MKPSLPIVCNMNVFTPEQRDAHLQRTNQLFAKVASVAAQENGYRFALPYEAESLIELGKFIANERLCCPFLEFSLTVKPGEEPVLLSLSGPEGTREFLRAEFSEAFA